MPCHDLHKQNRESNLARSVYHTYTQLKSYELRVKCKGVTRRLLSTKGSSPSPA